jgi:hypothetical protein
MRSLCFFILCLATFSSFASSHTGETFKWTIDQETIIPESKLDLIGRNVVNEKDGTSFQGQCLTRSEKGDCQLLGYVLKANNKNYLVHAYGGSKVKVDLARVNDALEKKYLESLRSFFDLDSRYSRMPGDFTGFLGMQCAYNSAACALLVLLPATITLDIALLPVDLGARFIQENRSRQKAKSIVDMIEGDDEVLTLSNRKFHQTLDGLTKSLPSYFK